MHLSARSGTPLVCGIPFDLCVLLERKDRRTRRLPRTVQPKPPQGDTLLRRAARANCDGERVARTQLRWVRPAIESARGESGVAPGEVAVEAARTSQRRPLQRAPRCTIDKRSVYYCNLGDRPRVL